MLSRKRLCSAEPDRAEQVGLFEQPTPLGELHVRWTGGTLPGVGDDGATAPDRSVVEHVEEEYS